MVTTNEIVLITGGSGFLGSHCIVQVLQRGYQVHTTVRSLTRADEVRKALINGGSTKEQADSVKFFAADLLNDQGWDEACAGCTYVLHVASPFPSSAPKDEDELIKPAREGTLRALRTAKKAGTVKRVVVTSSFAAVGYGHPPRAKENPFTEKDWTDLSGTHGKVPAYQKSKTLAEKAAWEYIEKEGEGLELAVVNPVGIFGPILGANVATSLEIPIRLLNGQMPGLPQICIGAVDVRDVADLHLRAMTDPKAAGERFLAITDDTGVWLTDIAKIYKTELSAEESKKVPTRSLPNLLLRFAALFDATIGLIVPELGKEKPTSNAKAKEQLGWQPRTTKEALLSSASSLKEHGLVGK